jgi:DNA repair exonuclease SbcCD ATPase subunit
LASISLKLAAAESASSCDIPMILDEPFAGLDTESKSGACRAIRNAARKLQIIVFTCDRETNEIFSSMSGAAIINMGMPHRKGTSHATL